MTKPVSHYVLGATASALALAAAGNASALQWDAGDATIDLYGYARLNASVDFEQDATTNFGTRAGSFDGTVVNAGNDDSGEFGADARQSRLGVTVRHDSGVRVTVEGDFRGNTLRLRQAYGEYEGILAGQTWSNYNSFVGYTSSVDFDALAGLAGYQARTAQLRYTVGNFSVALEEPIGTGRALENELDRSTGNTNAILDSEQDDFSRSNWPTLTARYESSIDSFSYSVAGLVHEVKGDRGRRQNPPTGDVEDDMIGGAAFVAGSFQVTDAVTLNATFNVSEGANTYLYRSGDDFGAPDGYFDGDDMERISGYGGHVGASIKAGQGSFNVGVGSVTNDWDEVEDAQPNDPSVGTEHETNTNAIANYMWRPVEQVMFGAELQHLDVELQNGNEFDANRAMFAAQYNF